MGQRDDEYHRLEGKKEGKLKIKREWNYAMFFAYSMASFMILYAMTPEGKDVTIDMFIGNPGAGNQNFNYSLFYFIAGALSFLIWGILMPDSYEQQLRAYQLKAMRRKKQLTGYEQLKLKMFFYFDALIFWIMYPISALLFNATANKEERKALYFRFGWVGHIEKTFFKQIVEKEDGYERADKLRLLANYPEILSGKKGADAKRSKEFLFTSWLFKNKKSMDDLFLIAEGYIALKRKEKFDRILSAEEFKEKMSKYGADRERGLDSFRMYNGSDEILWSSDLVFEFVEQETKKFEDYINKYALNSRTLFSRRFQIYSGALFSDKNIKKYLFANEEMYKNCLADPSVFSKHLSFVLTCYFRFILLKMIIGEYINLPAGTTVVKIRDYTLKMIVETFDDESLVGIVPGKNDGSTLGFNSDNLANVFLASFNHFKKSTENSFDKRIYKIFNFRDEEVIHSIEEKDIDQFSEKLKDGLAVVQKDAPVPDEWLSRLKEDLAKNEQKSSM